MEQICKKCILPDTFMGISFNQKGLCSYCYTHEQSSRLGEERLIKDIKRTKGKSSYDCVMPLSGGKDSTYILYFVVRELKLKPIAVHYDNNFVHKIALENIDNACRILGIPLFRIKANGYLQRLRLRMILRVSERMRSFIGICTNCEMLIRTVAVCAAKHYSSSTILLGSTRSQAINEEVYHSYREQSGFVERALLGQSGFMKTFRLDTFVQSFPPLMIFVLLSIFQRIQMGVPIKYVLSLAGNVHFPVSTARFIYVDDYIDLNREDYISVLKKELSWEHPPGKVSRFDCRLHCFPNYSHFQRNGITHDGVTYASKIREGYMLREEGLLGEQEAVRSLEIECKKVCEELGLRNYRIPQRFLKL